MSRGSGSSLRKVLRITAARWTSSISLKFTLSPTRDAGREKTNLWDNWKRLRYFCLRFYCMPFADHNKQNKEQKGHNNLTGWWEFLDCADSHLTVRTGSNKGDSIFAPSPQTAFMSRPTWVVFELDLLHQRHVGRAPEDALDLQTWRKTHKEREGGGGERSWWRSWSLPSFSPSCCRVVLVVAFYEDVELSRAAVAEDQGSPWSERKLMVSLITTGTQSPSGLLCRSLTQNSEGGLQSSA